ncbi:50S ribosomal protein L18 [Anaeropeptidivorans aminofermentans]|jgi:large subunit ribosomal protein L18|uniref:50S ribosomal protein L18 n=1 Tax=Anaeropeptidivorans aminofermentans TaxID=2934315 RepID=UPI00202590F7|nr:50S ribosomal protein L18 [Anaeropeptidivorans aminofermentans]MBE6012224.1 50S ribosomal protein L18 [Lachnospiraceae bacterium]
MIMKPSRSKAREKRHYRLRNKINGTASKPRLAVFRSNSHIYAQLIDDVAGHTLAAASTMEKSLAESLKSTSNVEAAKIIGAEIGKRAVEKGITEVVFDRGGYVYHGKVKALADAAREAGLNF